ncbi:MAG: acyl-ACP--UDP-N-acetylglucosamine O-acyltransferase [Pseudomonadota bacterium]
MSETQIHPSSIVEPGAKLGVGVEIGPFCVVGRDVVLGDGAYLQSHITVEGITRIGARARIHPHAAIGGPPQHRTYKGEPTTLTIGDDCEIRESVIIHRGTDFGGGETVIGDGCSFLSAAHVAHDCRIADGAMVGHNGGVAGHAIVDEGAIIGSYAAIHQFCRIGAYAFIGGCAAVANDVIPYGSALGNHASLGGLNIIGLKRAGLDRKTIHAMRAAYNEIFLGGDMEKRRFAERVDGVAKTYADVAEVMRIIAFIRAGAKRALMGAR